MRCKAGQCNKTLTPEGILIVTITRRSATQGQRDTWNLFCPRKKWEKINKQIKKNSSFLDYFDGNGVLQISRKLTVKYIPPK